MIFIGVRMIKKQHDSIKRALIILRNSHIAVLIMLLLIVLQTVTHFRTNLYLENIRLLKNLDLKNSGNPNGVLELNSDARGSLIFQYNNLTSCQLLWLSRIQAKYNYSAAQSTLNHAIGCERKALVCQWAGNLAWLQGDREQSRSWWLKLPASTLARWGYLHLQNGEIDKGLWMFSTVENGKFDELYPSEQVKLLFELGLFYRSQNDIKLATVYFEKAWAIDPDRRYLAYYLGLNYNRQERYLEAVKVLENGLENIFEFKPLYASNYYLELGRAYSALGNKLNAINAYQTAQEMLNLGKENISVQSFFTQQERIETLINSIER